MNWRGCGQNWLHFESNLSRRGGPDEESLENAPFQPTLCSEGAGDPDWGVFPSRRLLVES
jgi:hypothetical protein